MAIPLEDNSTDILSKAQRGLELSDTQLAEKSGVPSEMVRRLCDGEFDRAALDQIAPVLQLNVEALAKLAQANWQPDEISLAGLAQFNTPYHDIHVNSYLVWDPSSKDAVVFDAGADCSRLLEKSNAEGLTIDLILLTHAHSDHVADLKRLA